jgi:hypothetical protein
MREKIYRIACSSAVRLGAVLMLLHTSANAQDSADLERCASLDDPQARLECYDTASRRQRDSRAPAAKPDPDDSREPAQPAPLSDVVGEEQIETKDVKEGRGRRANGISISTTARSGNNGTATGCASRSAISR